MVAAAAAAAVVAVVVIVICHANSSHTYVSGLALCSGFSSSSSIVASGELLPGYFIWCFEVNSNCLELSCVLDLDVYCGLN